MLRLPDGVPSWYTEYECDLGAATHDASVIFQSPDDPKAQVWSRLFEKGMVIVNRLTSSNFTLQLPRSMRQIPLSKKRSMLTDQREAPAWQLIIDKTNEVSSSPCWHQRPLRLNQPTLSQQAGVSVPLQHRRAAQSQPVAMDWWASQRAEHFKFCRVPTLGQWLLTSRNRTSWATLLLCRSTTQVSSQGQPPSFAAGYFFVAPSTDFYNFALDKVQAHLYPLSDGTLVCLVKQRTVRRNFGRHLR